MSIPRTFARFLKLDSRELDYYREILDWDLGFSLLLKFLGMYANASLQGSAFNAHLRNPYQKTVSVISKRTPNRVAI